MSSPQEATQSKRSGHECAAGRRSNRVGRRDLRMPSIQIGEIPEPDMKLTSYWLDTSEPFRSATTGPVQGSCEHSKPNPWKDFAWPAIPGHLGPPGSCR